MHRIEQSFQCLLAIFYKLYFLSQFFQSLDGVHWDCFERCTIVVDYCNSVLIGTTEENLKKLQRVQNSLARVVSGSRRSDHITPVLSDLHWLPVRERINFKFGCLAFKSKFLGQPSYLSDLLHPYIPVRNLRSASSAENNFCVPFTRLKITSRAFSVAAPRIWNEIPAVIRNSDDVKNFGKQLKTFLFSRAFKTVWRHSWLHACESSFMTLRRVINYYYYYYYYYYKVILVIVLIWFWFDIPQKKNIIFVMSLM